MTNLAKKLGIIISSSQFIIGLGVLLVIILSVIAYQFSQSTGEWMAIEWSDSGINTGPNINYQTPTATIPPQTTIKPKPTELSIPKPTLVPWDGATRVTVLILGLDERDKEYEQGRARSDTMILLTLDPLSRTAGVLSIPRDMWVAIPGFEHGKINTAYYLGEAYKLPGGGPGLAIKTVEQFLGVPIHYYARVDFDAFIKFINEIGGVKIDVPEEITIDLFGSGSDSIKVLQPGVQTLPGEWALAYARNRKTEGGDFARAARQQQVILGIRNRILNLNLLPVMISRAPTLYESLSSGIHTNLTLDEVIKLALLAKDIPSENIKKAVIGEGNILYGKSYDDLAIVIPIPDKVHLLRDEIFVVEGSLGPSAVGSPSEKAVGEQPVISLYNASWKENLELDTALLLEGLGFQITKTGKISSTYAYTSIIDHRGKPYSIDFIVQELKIANYRIFSEFDPNAEFDIEVYLGNDWADIYDSGKTN